VSSHSRKTRKKKRPAWFIPVLATVILFLGGVSVEILGADLETMTKPYRKWVWTIFFLSLLVAVIVAIREKRQSDDESDSGDDNSTNQGNINIGDNAQNNQMTSQVENVGTQEIKGDKAGRDINKNYYQPAPPVMDSLHQLPSPPRDFVGRRKEMKELLKALEKSGVTISGLHGLGGVGKTALALKLAEQLKPHYPEAQFYLDLKGASTQPISASDAMAHVIRSYEPEFKTSDNENEIRGKYLSVLHNKRALLLMDNAANRRQIEPLIPPDSCVLLVTSRNHFTMNGFIAKNLDALEPKDARELLLKIAPRIDKCADEMAKLCGYLALALELAASALSVAVNYTPEQYLQKLSKAKERVELIEASLSLSYDLLNEDMQSLWRRLAVFPNTFDEAATAALWKIEIEEAKDKLRELITYSLLEYDRTAKRYRLHDLVRLFADARMSESERHSAKKLHATHYRNVLAQADDLYLEGGDAVLRGLQLFDLERENVEAGQVCVESFDEQDVEAMRLSMKYYHAGVYVLGLRLHARETIRWLETTLKAAHQLKDKLYEGAALGDLGLAYADLGETRKAIQFYEPRIAIAQETGDRRSEGIALGNLGIAYADLGETRKAIQFYEQQLVITQEIGDRRGEGSALGNLGNAYADLGETRKAIQLYEEALVIDREIGNRRGEGSAFGNLGIAYANLGETRKAIEYHEQALTIHREIGDRRGEGSILGNLGLAYANLGETRKAIQFYEPRIAIAQETGDRRGEGIALGNLGNAYADLGETRKAIQFYEQQLVITQEIGDRRGEGVALWNTAVAYSNLGEHAKAIAFAEEALKIYDEVEHPNRHKHRATLEEWKAEGE
jgi:tetratricopeptide (TPR) repeat protein